MWVQIEKVVLKASQRTSKIPEDTLKCDYVMRINGYADNAEIGKQTEITTLTGRKVSGRVVEVNPKFRHDFGEPVEELMHVGRVCRKELAGGEQ
ncbi:MAG: 2-amino-4-oxopentanoate thiolase subunit OrtA [Candidatus Muiribacteriota bacterium]|jgi:hypothetical protein